MTLSEPPSRIPTTKLDNFDDEIGEQLLAAVERVARAGAFTLGAEVEAFEQEYAEYCGTPHAIGVSSGTSAIELTLRALGIGQGDEVLVPANTFIATAEAVSAIGATPKFIDVDRSTAVINADLVEAALGPRTRCVIAVHLFGRTVDLDPIVELAHARGIAVIEDACQAHGAIMRGRRAGAVADAGCFSFYPSKNLGGWGDGGCVVTGDAVLAETVRRLRSHGESTRYQHEMIGTTARLDAIQAAVLRVKLTRLDAQNAARRRIGATLINELEGTAVIPPAAVAPGGDHVFHQFVIESGDRDALRARLAQHDIDTAIHYPVPIHLTPAYAWAGLGPGSLPVCERLAERACSLPMFPSMSDHELSRLICAVGGF
jgi:dTDP-3-amino-3,4,6-trideoxy-alpha-D-glucose transaminase